MKSVVVHYQEIALKGKNRPWFVARLARNVRQATSRSRHRRGPRADGPSRSRARPVSDMGDGARNGCSDVFGIANFARAGRARAGRRCHRRCDPRRSRRPCSRPTFRVSRAPRRQAISAHLAADRTRGRRTIKEARGWRVDLDAPELTIHVETLTNEAFYFFGKDRGAGGLPTGCQRTSRLPAVRRHRLARRRVANDAARLPRAVRALSQLSDSVARVTGEGARARAAADAFPVRLAVVPGPVRRDSAAGRADRRRRRCVSSSIAGSCSGSPSGSRVSIGRSRS